MIDNNKLAKELSAIYASSNKAKKSVVAEIAKVDEKYRKLAEQEKAELNKTLEMLDAQLKYYGTILGLSKKDENEVKEEKEEAIEDTIFPENNEEVVEPEAEEETTEEEPTEVTPEPEVVEGDDASESMEWPDETSEETTEEQTKEKEEEKTAEEDVWPDFPQEWK